MIENNKQHLTEVDNSNICNSGTQDNRTQHNYFNTTVIQQYSADNRLLAKEILENLFGVSEDAFQQIRNNQDNYGKLLKDMIQKIVLSTVDEVIEDKLRKNILKPDFQYVNQQALITASRDDKFHQQISLLVSARLEYADNEAITNLHNQAIEIINKLTINQLNLLTVLAIIGLNIFVFEDIEVILNIMLPILQQTTFGIMDRQNLNHLGCILWTPIIFTKGDGSKKNIFKHYEKFYDKYPALTTQVDDKSKEFNILLEKNKQYINSINIMSLGSAKCKI